MKFRNGSIQICLLVAMLIPALKGGAQPVTSATGGYGHSLFIKSDGSLWGMGFDTYGQLGDGGAETATNIPQRIASGGVTAAAAGFGHTLFITNGALWAMGFNVYGELGDGSRNTSTHPELIAPANVTAVAAGDYHSLFIRSGALYAMGDNFSGQLGDGTTDNGTLMATNPEVIVPINVTAVAAGSSHSLFITAGGTLWGMGYNKDGELGDGSTTKKTVPEQIVPSGVTAVAAGNYHSLFLKSDGSLWGMGNNQFGQLGVGNGTTNNILFPTMLVASNVTAMAAGFGDTLFLKSDGSLWAMGINDYGQLGGGSFVTNAPYGTNQPQQIAASGVAAVGAGYYHSFFVNSNGSLWAMGENVYGELGDGVSYAAFSNLNATNQPEQILGPFNQLASPLLAGNLAKVSFQGVGGTNYALDRTLSLSLPNWLPQITNQAGISGLVIFTNQPDPATNNFWRVRSVP